MTCHEVNAFLDEPNVSELPAAVLEHVATCPGCSRLLAVFRRAPQSAAVEAHVGALPKSLLHNLKPVRPLPSSPVLLAIWVGAAAVISALGVWMWGTSGWAALPGWNRFLVVGFTLATLLSAAYGLTVQMAPGTKRHFSFFGVEIAAIALFVVTVALTYHHTYSFPLPPVDRHCFFRGLGISGLAALFVLPRMQRGVWLDRASSALNIAAFVSAICLLVFDLYCPVLNFRHVFVAHFGALAVVMLAGAVAALIWSRVSS